ncbi:hypothetical protein [Phytohabitans kaempferiae]|uniref:Uncharacterized protein n=1 Tax=Phytohabitans kaempferiae TaxID=1620943 RepID=A0ABV6MEZ2_9ACTN
MTPFATIAVEPGRLRLGAEVVPLRVDATSGAAGVTWGGADYRLRPWTFGERRRLLAAHHDGVTLDVGSLVESAIELLVEPVPARSTDREVVGLAALAWCATAGARTPAPVPGVDAATQMVRLAKATGWGPAEIDASAAADVDRWYHAVRAEQVPEPGPEPATAPAGEDESYRVFRLED